MPAAFLIAPLGRTYLFQAIKEKGLIAQKAVRLTILTHENIPSQPPRRRRARQGGTRWDSMIGELSYPMYLSHLKLTPWLSM
jgi:hypothetical protein